MKQIMALFFAAVITCQVSPAAYASDNAHNRDGSSEWVMVAEDDVAPAPLPEEAIEQTQPPEPSPAPESVTAPDPVAEPEPQPAPEPATQQAPESAPEPAPEPTPEPAPEPDADRPES